LQMNSDYKSHKSAYVKNLIKKSKNKNRKADMYGLREKTFLKNTFANLDSLELNYLSYLHLHCCHTR